LVKYNSSDGIIEVIIRDETGRKLEHFKMNLNDKEIQITLFRKLRDKYGICLDNGPAEFREKPFFEQ